MSQKIELILKELKGMKIAVSKIEKDLGFSNGSLAQAAKGKYVLSAAKEAMLDEYYSEKTGKPREFAGIQDLRFIEPPKSDPNEVVVFNGPQFLPKWADEIKAYCEGVGLNPEDLVSDHMKLRSEIEGLKKAINAPKKDAEVVKSKREENHTPEKELTQGQLEIRKKKLGF